MILSGTLITHTNTLSDEYKQILWLLIWYRKYIIKRRDWIITLTSSFINLFPLHIYSSAYDNMMNTIPSQFCYHPQYRIYSQLLLLLLFCERKRLSERFIVNNSLLLLVSCILLAMFYVSILLYFTDFLLLINSSFLNQLINKGKHIFNEREKEIHY